MVNNLGQTIVNTLNQFNGDNGKAWTWGTNFVRGKNDTGIKIADFDNYVNNYLFPKLNETMIIESANGNRFDFLAKEEDFIGQYSEEYVILDSVPVTMDLTKNAELMLKRNYPKIATKLYGTGILKKQKFTLNNNAQRFAFATLGDAITYAVAVYKKKLSDINLVEEAEMKAMIIDYAMNQAKDVRTDVTSMEGLVQKLATVCLNLQNNSAKHNEADTASGGTIARYTPTPTKLSDILIVTNDNVKSYLLNSFLANTFHNEGIDLTSHIVSFDDMGGVYKITEEVTVTSTDVAKMQAYGDYQVAVGDTIPVDTVLTFEPPKGGGFYNNTTPKFKEIKPDNDLFAVVLDINAIRYKRYTKDMLKEPFYNGEFDEVTYWIHYYSMKAISPFYNKVVLAGTQD